MIKDQSEISHFHIYLSILTQIMTVGCHLYHNQLILPSWRTWFMNRFIYLFIFVLKHVQSSCNFSKIYLIKISCKHAKTKSFLISYQNFTKINKHSKYYKKGPVLFQCFKSITALILLIKTYIT